MAATVRLTVLTGMHKGNRFCFRKTDDTMIGRASECDVCVCGGQRDLQISRRHCSLKFEPPHLLVRDIGSLNGTFVNGISCASPFLAKDGDVLTIGGTSMQINVMDCEECEEESNIQVNCPIEC
jgi:pSer/pThr/pTyr-binding forkhead associated (FHA) protein